MALDVILKDGHGKGTFAKVNGEGELSVVVHPHPPVDEEVNALPFRQYFTDNGLTTGSNDMRVNGSTTPVEFYIEAIPTKDIYIKTISILIADAGATLNEFGNLSALSNGCSMRVDTQDIGTVTIADSLTTNFEFVRLAIGEPSFGSGAAAFQAGNIQGTSEGYMPVMDLANIFGLPFGIRLRKGTKDKIVLTVNDNVSTIDAFNIIAYGLQL